MFDPIARLSRTLSYALRHHPEAFGLVLDANGWASIDDLLSAFKQHQPAWQSLTHEDVKQVLAQSTKTRFEVRDGHIRALYGHSTGKKIKLTPVEPPAYLFHGTTPAALKQISATGLFPMRRQYVHLSLDTETARDVALRRTSTPVILTVLSGQAARQGVRFYFRIDQVWLSDSIGPEFLDIPVTS